MAKQQLDYIAYMLRMWRTEQDGAWKASLEDPHTGSLEGFNSLHAMLEFLHQQMVLFLRHDSSQKTERRK